MSAADDRDARLERLIAQALSQHSLRPAPADLEARVLAEIERRAGLPWWQRRLAAWPQRARLALAVAGIVAGLGCINAVRWLALQLQGVLSAAAAPLLADVHRTGELLLALARAGAALLAAFPAGYLYTAVALTAVAYFVVFATAAFGYRMLGLGAPYPQHASSR